MVQTLMEEEGDCLLDSFLSLQMTRNAKQPFKRLLTNAIRLTILMLKLTFSSSATSGAGSIRGMVNNHADTYMMGADRKVLITIPDVTSREDRKKTFYDLDKSVPCRRVKKNSGIMTS